MTGQPMTPSASTPHGAAFTAWLTASCQRQGVPVTIRDPGIITQVAILLGQPATAGASRETRRVVAPFGSREGGTHAGRCRRYGVSGNGDPSRCRTSRRDPDGEPRAA